MTSLEVLKRMQTAEIAILRIKHALDIKDLIESGESDTMVSPEVADIITAFDTATDAIAARIQRLIDKPGVLTADDKAALQAEATKLNALGKDPENPIAGV